MAVLNPEDAKRIEERVREVEGKSAGEIVVAVVDRSSDYAARRALHTVGAALLSASLIHHLWQQLDADIILLVQLPLGALFWALSGTPRALRWLVPRAERQQAVEERAARLFTERGVFDTRDHSGVLLMLSEAEHKVVMLGDRGIHARVETQGWERHVRTIVEAIRAGRAVDGVCQVLDELGQVLETAFPRRHDDENELPDAVVREER